MVPVWAVDAASDGTPGGPDDDGRETSVLRGSSFTLVSTGIPGARGLGSTQLRTQTARAYETIFDLIGTRHLIRVWNFIPELLNPVGEISQRYLVFNAGRHDAFSRHWPHPGDLAASVPTASGVGTSGDDLKIFALASDQPGKALGNPRQVDSFRYSKQYGDPPPCFARATVISRPDGGKRLLVGGTASVRGESTVFQENLEYQISETFKNLAALVAVGLDSPYLDIEDPEKQAGFLARFHHIRTYYTLPGNRDAIASGTAKAFPNANPLELTQAELCREGLLVEIEGWADLG
jgi:chorismate lyase/3-hydroxybenzoate synthase